MATYDVHALRNTAPQGVRGGGGGARASRALDHIWVDKVTFDMPELNAALKTNIAAGDIITFGPVRREQVLLQGGVRVDTASTAAATLDLGHSTDRDAFLDGTSIASTGYTSMIAANQTPIRAAVRSTGVRTITMEFKTGTAAGAIFTVTWVWLDVDLDEKLYGVG